MKQLYLPLKEKWFEKIKSGEKIVEYREAKEYWLSRLYCTHCAFYHKTFLDAPSVYTSVRFSKGYSAKEKMVFEIVDIDIVDGKNTDLHIDKQVFAIKLGARLS